MALRGGSIDRLGIIRIRFAQPAEVSVAVLEVPSAYVVALGSRALMLHAEGRSMQPREIVDGVRDATCHAQVSLAVGMRREGRGGANLSVDVEGTTFSPTPVSVASGTSFDPDSV